MFASPVLSWNVFLNIIKRRGEGNITQCIWLLDNLREYLKVVEMHFTAAAAASATTAAVATVAERVDLRPSVAAVVVVKPAAAEVAVAVTLITSSVNFVLIRLLRYYRSNRP